MTNPKITVFAPHDRINYGDFLFAIMLDYSLGKSGIKTPLGKHSIISADYSEIGAYKTKSYIDLKKSINKNELTTIIVGGGQSLSGTWVTIYSYISPIAHFLTFKLRLYKLKFYHTLIKKILGARSEFPYNINKNDFPNKNLKVIYNSIGCSHLSLDGIERLKKADYISVRDLRSYNSLNKSINNIYLVPDSAIILSDVYPLNSLRVNGLPKKSDYIFFQLSLHKYGSDLKPILEELNKILKNTELNIALCPIGTAPGHNDDVILQKIKSYFNNNNRVEYIDRPSISKIAQLIGESRCYIGTSLHGVITAMSYGIPYIALNPSQLKVQSYLETWSIEELKVVSDTNNFFAPLVSILQKEETIKVGIFENTKIQKLKYYESAERISKIIV